MAQRRTERISKVIQKHRWREADARLVIAASQASGKPLLSFAREYGRAARTYLALVGTAEGLAEWDRSLPPGSPR